MHDELTYASRASVCCSLVVFVCARGVAWSSIVHPVSPHKMRACPRTYMPYMQKNPPHSIPSSSGRAMHAIARPPPPRLPPPASAIAAGPARAPHATKTSAPPAWQTNKPISERKYPFVSNKVKHYIARLNTISSASRQIKARSSRPTDDPVTTQPSSY